MKRLFSLLALLALCWSQVVQAANSSLIVSAAASFKDAIEELKTEFAQQENIDVFVNYAGSGILALQIINGASVDIFISADKKSMRDVQAQGGLVDNSIFMLCQNSLVAVTPQDFNLKIYPQDPYDAKVLTSKQIKRIALGNTKTVPAGSYALEALQQAGLFAQLEPKLIYTQNVRQALNYVLKGEVDVALVYSSDFFIHKEQLKQIIELKTETKIASYAALVKQDPESDMDNEEARLKFFEYLKSRRAQEVFKKYGFKLDVGETK